jgi:hypothetical protein
LDFGFFFFFFFLCSSAALAWKVSLSLSIVLSTLQDVSLVRVKAGASLPLSLNAPVSGAFGGIAGHDCFMYGSSGGGVARHLD